MTFRNDPLFSLIVYGGAFDPPHLGHEWIVSELLKKFSRSRILVVPTFQPPAGGPLGKTPVTPFSHRLAMAEAAFTALEPLQGLADSPGSVRRLAVSALESSMPQPTYTIQTLEHLAEGLRAPKMGLVMGEDQFRAFANWREPQRILALAKLIVFPRRSTPRDLAAEAQEILRSIHVVPAADTIQIWAEAPPDVSSTDVRRAMLEGLTDSKSVRELVSDRVRGYIKAHRLYVDDAT